jgi:26S proteasome regulatory subunit N4
LFSIRVSDSAKGAAGIHRLPNAHLHLTAPSKAPESEGKGFAGKSSEDKASRLETCVAHFYFKYLTNPEPQGSLAAHPLSHLSMSPDSQRRQHPQVAVAHHTAHFYHHRLLLLPLTTTTTTIPTNTTTQSVHDSLALNHQGHSIDDDVPIRLVFKPDSSASFPARAQGRTTHLARVEEAPYMHSTSNGYPSIRVQQFAQGAAATHRQAQLQKLENGQGAQDLWTQPTHEQHLLSYSQRQSFGRPTQIVGHKRNSSGSTIASTGPSSPFTPASSLYPHIVESDNYNYSTFAESFEHTQNFGEYAEASVAAPVSTFSDYFNLSQQRDFSIQQDADLSPYQLSMIDNMAQQGVEQGVADLRKTPSREYSEEFKHLMEGRSAVPKLDRTMSDIYQDELYNPNIAPAPPIVQPSQKSLALPQSHLSPRRDVFSERLQAANNVHISARSGSPADSLPRERSPFRANSQYVNDEIPTGHSASPGPRLGSVAHLRERQKAEADARALARHTQSSAVQNARTISPKEALLDMRDPDEEAMPSLFDSTEAPSLQSRCGQVDESFSTVDNESSISSGLRSSQNIENIATATETSARSVGETENPRRQRSTPQLHQQYPFISQPRRQNSSAQSNSDSVPEFPAHLTSMESTKSESKGSESLSELSDIQRPSSTKADSGTYSCTYHGCSMRFETPAKLQRHKRDGHRQATPPTPSTLDAAMSRNSQAGPHKCERINPSTGKPCNSIFSRPYDLTRHEDTIHNARKQKVRCQFCTEEKTFSRNDALTRHMRVVHPEVDFPGKSKRKA